MEKSNLSSRKPTTEQELNEGFSGKNLNKNKNFTTPDLKKEVETDEHGNLERVDRARYVGKNLGNLKSAPQVDYPTESIHQTPETAEHKDFNSNPNPKEFPDKNKKNKENLGNIE